MMMRIWIALLIFGPCLAQGFFETDITSDHQCSSGVSSSTCNISDWSTCPASVKCLNVMWAEFKPYSYKKDSTFMGIIPGSVELFFYHFLFFFILVSVWNGILLSCCYPLPTLATYSTSYVFRYIPKPHWVLLWGVLESKSDSQSVPTVHYSWENPLVYRHCLAIQHRWCGGCGAWNDFCESRGKPFSGLHHKEKQRKCYTEEIDRRCVERMACLGHGIAVVFGLWRFPLVPCEYNVSLCRAIFEIFA
jgi:hypothetical protein